MGVMTMNTYKKYSERISDFFQTILDSNPDYIVPVERKGCKLLRSLHLNHLEITPQIRYKQFFDNNKPDMRGKRVAIIDDASKFTSTLFEYREYFEKLGATVDTYSFVGQESLRTGEREQYDGKAHIFQFLNESTYQEYIIQQSIELSKEDNFFDVDHLVFRTKMVKDRFDLLFAQIEGLGMLDYSGDVYTPEVLTKFCLYDFTFSYRVPFDNSIGIYNCPMQKIRFAYNEDCETLSIVPLALVSWDSNASVDLMDVFNTIGISPLYELGSKIESEGMYMNIMYICCLYLLKSFLSQITGFPELEQLEIEDYDLLAYVGSERVKLLKESIATFLKYSINCNTYTLQRFPKPFDSLPKFRSVLGLMRHLRGEYERRIAANNSVLGIRYFLSYDELFARYNGRASLMKWVDILCDRGVLVARNISFNGVYCRACRSGEADYDHMENKTSILLPIIIDTCGKRDGKVYRIRSTLLNKIIANLSYDYPNDTYDFHNFFTKPYLYGPFTYVKNQLNEEVEISLYDAEQISRYCAYDEKNREFIALAPEYITGDINAFSQCDMVPFTEIISYIDCLRRISDQLDKADALNELAICREQDTYYRHVHFDIITAHTNIMTAYYTPKPEKAERCLRDAAKIINEAIKKLNYEQKSIFSRLEATVGTDIRYRIAYQTIIKSKIDFDSSFLHLLPNLRNVAHIEQALTNLMLYRITLNIKYLAKFYKVAQTVDAINAKEIEKLSTLYGSAESDEYNKLFETCEDSIRSVVDQLCQLLYTAIRELPKPKDSEHLLRAQRQNINLAVNRGIQYIKKHNLREYTLLHFDYSGYRNTDGSKAVNVIDHVQNTLPHLLNNFDCSLIYGLTGELACGTVLFSYMEDAIRCAKKIRYLFSDSDSELTQVIFKFGCCCRSIIDEKDIQHAHVKQAWDNAVDCSSQKYVKAELMIAHDTYECLGEEMRKEFAMIVPEFSRSETEYYAHKEFVSVDSSQVIRYRDDTDDSVEIGIVTALTEEFVAMQKMLIEPKTLIFPKSKAVMGTTGREYCIGKIRSLDGKYHRVALTQTIGPGTTSAAIRANSLLQRFPNLDVIIMTGIAGGIPSPEDNEKHVRLGDIVVAESIIAYDFVSEKKEFKELRGRSVPPSARLFQAQQQLQARAFMEQRPWEAYIDELGAEMPTKFARPTVDTDILHDHSGNPILHPMDPSRTTYPRVFTEKIACANRVLKNPVKRDQLKQTHNVYAVEMESSGIADSAWEAQIGYYVVRGISDYCDGHKNDIWHNYAALVAAAYTRALIENLPY